MSEAYVKFKRNSEKFREIIMIRPTAFVLLATIAERARRTDSTIGGLTAGEALVGDYKSYGVSRQNYRSDLKFLEKSKILTIKVTNKGTIAKLIDDSIFDINIDEGNQQTNHQVTINQPSSNHQVTTNNNVKKDKNDKNVKKEIKRRVFFKKPSIEDVEQYFTELNCSGQGEKFFDFYESKGWLIGNAKMKDWRPAVRNWARNTSVKGGNGKVVKSSKDPVASGDTSISFEDLPDDEKRSRLVKYISKIDSAGGPEKVDGPTRQRYDRAVSRLSELEVL